MAHTVWPRQMYDGGGATKLEVYVKSIFLLFYFAILAQLAELIV